MKKTVSLSLLVFICFFLNACASLNEGAKCVLGISTKALEDNRASAVKQTFATTVPACFDMSLEILEQEKFVAYSRNRTKRMIALFFSETDSTPVGVFFNETASGLTQVEVSSPSTFAKETLASKLFAGIVKKLNPAKVTEKKQKEESNAVQY